MLPTHRKGYNFEVYPAERFRVTVSEMMKISLSNISRPHMAWVLSYDGGGKEIENDFSLETVSAVLEGVHQLLIFSFLREQNRILWVVYSCK